MSLASELLRFLFHFFAAYVLFAWELIVGKKVKSLDNNVVLITGAGHGLGRQLALCMARAGARLALLDINAENLRKVVAEIEAIQGSDNHVTTCVVDVSDDQALRTGIANCEKELGQQVDILINNAGIAHCVPFEQLSLKEVKQIFSVNVFPYFTAIQAVLPGMKSRGSGHIVGIASIAGLTGTAYLTDYCASKFAVVGLMDALRMELDERGLEYIKTTTICPLAINTGMFKKPKSRFEAIFPVCYVEYVAQSIMKAIRQERKLITVPTYTELLMGINGTLPERAKSALRNFVNYGIEPHSKER